MQQSDEESDISDAEILRGVYTERSERAAQKLDTRANAVDSKSTADQVENPINRIRTPSV